jgi:aerobic C4-dicarboxylate transport protein
VFVPVNVLGNSLATIVMARWEGAVDLATLRAALRSGPGPGVPLPEALPAPAVSASSLSS